MLYICSTPIGNLGDITLRALEVIRQSGNVACENVSHTRAMLNHYGIKANLVSYREENRDCQSGAIFKILSSGENVVLVSDAGTPGISDPGFRLVDEALDKGFAVSVLPGPSSAISALVLSGFPADSFLFLGFLPRKNSKRADVYREIASSLRTIAFFEAPHRIVKTLGELSPFITGRRICLCRELTKKFEEVVRGCCDDVADDFAGRKIQGEFVVVVEPLQAVQKNDEIDDDLIEKRLLEKMTLKQIVEEMSSFVSNKKELYNRVLLIKKRIADNV